MNGLFAFFWGIHNYNVGNGLILIETLEKSIQTVLFAVFRLEKTIS